MVYSPNMEARNTARTRTAALQNLRARCRGKVNEDGIYLVVRFRDCYAADDFEKVVAECGGEVESRIKTHKSKFVGDRTHKVTFTVGIDEDLYLAGRINLRTLKSWA